MLAAGDVAAICPEAQFMDSVCAVGGMAGRVGRAPSRSNILLFGDNSSKIRRHSTPQKENKFMNLTETPQIVTWPETQYVFLEKIGPFQITAPAAWGDLHKSVPAISEHNKITGYTSLYKVGPKIYRAGVSLAAAPQRLPEGLAYEKFKAGKYMKFVLTGPYSNLPQASGRVFEIVAEKKIQLRDDYCIENYANDPRTTPEDKLITEILLPTV
jgi:effector-binding domain-containing protein